MGSGGVSALKLAIQKYGKENFYFEELSRCDSLEALDIAEIYWIDHLQTLAPDGYNLSPGGGAFVRTQATRDKISAKAKGRPSKLVGKKFTPEHRKALSDAHVGLPTVWKGRKHKEESKAKMSVSQKGRPGNSGSFVKGHPASAYSFKKGGVSPNKGRTRILVDGKARYIKKAP